MLWLGDAHGGITGVWAELVAAPTAISSSASLMAWIT
jgi:hypothetical protein